MTRINMALDDEVHKQAKLCAVISGMTLAHYISEAIKEKNSRKNKDRKGV